MASGTTTDDVLALGRSMMPRPRLEAALDGAEGARLTVVRGPAGAGTTSLLARWAYLRSQAAPGGVHWLTSRHGPLAEPITALDRRPVARRVTVVLDNADERDPVALRAAVAAAARRPHVRLILGLHAHGTSTLNELEEYEPTVIGPHELWFRPDEAAGLVLSRFPTAGEADVARALRLGEGWAAALLAAGRAAGRTRSHGLAPAGLDETLLDPQTLERLVEPNLRTLTDDERATLLAVAAPERLGAEDVLALTGDDASLRHLSVVAETSGLVTVPAGSGGPWRLHGVLRSHLTHLTSPRGPDHALKVRAHRRAVDYFTVRGERDRAVYHAAAGGDSATIVEALVEHGPSLVAEQHEQLFDRVAAVLPVEVAVGEPSLVAVRALRHRVAGDVGDALRDAARLAQLEHAARPGRGTPRPSVRHAADKLLLALSEARYGLVDAHAVMAAARPMMSGADDGDRAELCGARRAWLCLEMSAVSLWLGEVHEAALWTQRGMTIAELSGAPRLLASALAHQSLLEVVDGAYAAAGETARRCLVVAVTSHLMADVYLARAHVAAAWAAYARLDPESALEHLASVDRMSPHDLDPTVATLAEIVRGQLLTLVGHHEGAWKVLSARSVRREGLPAPLERLLAIARAEAAVGRHDMTALGRESNALDEAGHPEDATFFHAVTSLLEHDASRARGLLRGLLDHPTVLPTTGAASAALLVTLELVTEGPDAARPLVPDLLSRVATSAAEVFLVSSGASREGIADLIADEADRPDGHPHAAEVQLRLQRFHRRHPGEHDTLRIVGTEGSGHPLLTHREAAVLDCLREAMSYDAIARELYITPNTVKTHVRSIYRKLGVERAGQAVGRARELGLLSER